MDWLMAWHHLCQSPRAARFRAAPSPPDGSQPRAGYRDRGRASPRAIAPARSASLFPPGGQDACRARAREGKSGVGFEEMIMAADLDRAIARIGDGEHDRLEIGIQDDVTRSWQQFTGNHGTSSY